MSICLVCLFHTLLRAHFSLWIWKIQLHLNTSWMDIISKYFGSICCCLCPFYFWLVNHLNFIHFLFFGSTLFGFELVSNWFELLWSISVWITKERPHNFDNLKINSFGSTKHSSTNNWTIEHLYNCKRGLLQRVLNRF